MIDRQISFKTGTKIHKTEKIALDFLSLDGSCNLALDFLILCGSSNITLDFIILNMLKGSCNHKLDFFILIRAVILLLISLI